MNRRDVLPGFNIALGYTVFYLSLIVIIPLCCLIIKTSSLPIADFINIINNPRVIHAFKITLGCSFIATLINLFFGVMLAWVLVRYEFYGKKIIDAIVDLPFALPTAIAGISLATIYSNDGIIGKWFHKIGIKIAFTPIGIIIALIFIGIPFIVRTIEPIMRDLDREVEEAAICLGANKWQCFYKIILPNLFPAMLTGFSLAFARSVGEYGSVIFIAGNIPKFSEIIPLIITIKLEQYDYEGATALALLMLTISFILLLIINILQKWSQKFSQK
jgi:sulfate transport system permease protein